MTSLLYGLLCNTFTTEFSYNDVTVSAPLCPSCILASVLYLRGVSFTSGLRPGELEFLRVSSNSGLRPGMLEFLGVSSNSGLRPGD